MIIDSHCHLDEYYDAPKDIEGLDYCMAISCDTSSIHKFINFLNNTNNVFGGIGIHPEYASTFDSSLVEPFLNHKKIVGYGEIGLEYHYDVASRDLQIKMFEEQLDLAERYNLPVIIHNRESDQDMMDILSNFKLPNKGVLHCFSSSQKLWEYGLNRGFYISFSGMVTFKKLVDVQEMAKNTPVDRLLIETDSPYLAPEPFRGKRNRPELVKYTGEKIASLKEMDAEELINQTAENFFNLFTKAAR